jgi:hypothetical protein
LREELPQFMTKIFINVCSLSVVPSHRPSKSLSFGL